MPKTKVSVLTSCMVLKKEHLLQNEVTQTNGIYPKLCSQLRDFQSKNVVTYTHAQLRLDSPACTQALPLLSCHWEVGCALLWFHPNSSGDPFQLEHFQWTQIVLVGEQCQWRFPNFASRILATWVIRLFQILASDWYWDTARFWTFCSFVPLGSNQEEHPSPMLAAQCALQSDALAWPFLLSKPAQSIPNEFPAVFEVHVWHQCFVWHLRYVL